MSRSAAALGGMLGLAVAISAGDLHLALVVLSAAALAAALAIRVDGRMTAPTLLLALAYSRQRHAPRQPVLVRSVPQLVLLAQPRR